MEVKDYVIIKEDVKGLNGYAEIARAGRFPLFLYQKQAGNIAYVYTKDISKNKFQQNPFTIKEEHLVVLTDAELKKALKDLNKEHEAEMKIKLKSFKPRHVALARRKIENTSVKQFISTQINYLNLFNKVTLANGQFDTSKVSRSQSGQGATCCALSKTTNDVVVYIPKSWLNYFGYNLTDLKAYLDFLQRCEIGFEGRVLGVRTLKSVYGGNISDSIYLGNKSNNTYLNVNEDSYEIWINGNNRQMVTYMYFILIRFLYSNVYWNIPMIAMKLAKNIPDATPWECLLIAHCYQDYDGYYSLTPNTLNSMAYPSARNNQKTVLGNLGYSTSMNGSFYKYNDGNGLNLRKAITEENYETIGDLIKKYRNVN